MKREKRSNFSLFERNVTKEASLTLASNIAIISTNRAELNLYGSIGVVRVLRSDKNPSIKFTKLFREPLLQKLLASGVAEIAVLPVISASNNQIATHLMDGKARQPARLFASFSSFFFQIKKKDNVSPFLKGFLQKPRRQTKSQPFSFLWILQNFCPSAKKKALRLPFPKGDFYPFVSKTSCLNIYFIQKQISKNFFKNFKKTIDKKKTM